MKKKSIIRTSCSTLIYLTLLLASCRGQITREPEEIRVSKTELLKPESTGRQPLFPQIHSNLNGRVNEFVRTMHQDKQGNIWFGTNGDGIIRYDGQTLESIFVEGVSPHCRVLNIVEDRKGTLWFASSDGLLKYDGKEFSVYSVNEGLPTGDPEIWGLEVDQNGLVWVGSLEGVFQFDGERFRLFPMPDFKVVNQRSMMSDELVFQIIEDRTGAMWFVTDGNGIFKFHNDTFVHFTTENGLTDNNAADILEDHQGTIWIGTFFGGVSRFDGNNFTNFTQDGFVDGMEAYNLLEDSKGSIWFTAEGFGVYRYNGTEFKHFTAENGLTTNVVQSMFEDQKGHLWFGSWQGLCIFDGVNFRDAKEVEPWTN